MIGTVFISMLALWYTAFVVHTFSRWRGEHTEEFELTKAGSCCHDVCVVSLCVRVGFIIFCPF